MRGKSVPLFRGAAPRLRGEASIRAECGGGAETRERERELVDVKGDTREDSRQKLITKTARMRRKMDERSEQRHERVDAERWCD